MNLPQAQIKTVIANGSKSFFLASLFFGETEKQSAWKLYNWCRHCDDQIDNSRDTVEALAKLRELKAETTQAFEQRLGLTPPFESLAQIVHQHAIPQSQPTDLLYGMQMDVEGHTYETIEDLEKYAYHVAGVVGLMMCYVMRVSSERAYRHAIAMGNAMQLTNIARDVAEDKRLGRVYLPQSWLREFGITPGDLLEEHNRERVHALRLRLLAHADTLYKLGYEGVRYLPLRAALTICIAASVYSAIGTKIRRMSPHELGTRAVLNTREKIFFVLSGFGKFLRLLPSRWWPVDYRVTHS